MTRSQSDVMLLAGLVFALVGFFMIFPHKYYNEYMFWTEAFLLMLGVLLIIRALFSEVEEDEQD